MGEQRYSGINREAGRSLLEGLCVAKHHLKVPANVYVKKTALGQQTIDISGLAAPSSEKKDSEAVQSANSSQEVPSLQSPTSLKTEGVSCSLSIRTEPSTLSSAAPPSASHTPAPASTGAPLSPPSTPSPRTVPLSTVRLLVKPQGVKSVAPCSGRPSKSRLTNISSSASPPCPMEIQEESQASEESVSPGASPLRASSVSECLSTSQELDNLKGRSILANDNLKTSSTPDDNLIEKVDNRIAS